LQIGVFCCRCHGELEEFLDFNFLIEKIKLARGVAWVEIIDQACISPAPTEISRKIKEKGLNRVVIATCSPYLYSGHLFSLAKENGLHPQLVEVANIREQCAWVHPVREQATLKALDLIHMACARVSAVGTNYRVTQKGTPTALVNKLKCDRCKRCLEECPQGAYELDPDGFPSPNPEKCQRCGICVGGCPLQAISLPDFRLEEVAAMINAIDMAEIPEEEPVILGFFCRHDAYPEADRLGRERIPYPANLRIIRVPCSGAVNMSLVTDALSLGIDGVIIAGCRENQCRYKQGNSLVSSRIESLKETLARMMIEPERVRYLALAEVTPFVASIEENLCNGCLTCKQVCPFQAISPFGKNLESTSPMLSPKALPYIDPNLCRGCGICTVACRAGAIKLKGFSDQSILSQVDGCSSPPEAATSQGKGVLPDFLIQYVEELKTIGPNPFRLR